MLDQFPSLRRTLPLVCVLLAATTVFCQNNASTGTQPCIRLQNVPSNHGGAAVGSMLKGSEEKTSSGEKAITIKPDQNICPLTAGQKFGLWVRDSASFPTIMGATLGAAIWQGTDGHIDHTVHHEGYGQGWDSYGARYGATLANTVSTGFFTTAVFSSMFHEDPRYFRLGPSYTGGHRFGYAMSRIFVARSDSGKHHLNFSELMGTLASAGLSNAYYVERDRTAGRTMQTWGITLGSDMGWTILKEFGPDMWAKLRGKKAQ